MQFTDIQYYQKELQQALGIRIDGCVLSELPEKLHAEEVTNADFIVTTFSHVEDVKAILEPLGKDVIAIMAAPHLHTLIRISQLPAGARVGLACAVTEGAARMRRALELAGIQHVSLEHAGVYDGNKLQEMLKRIDWAVCSRVVIDDVRRIIPESIQIIEFSNVLDQDGVQMLKQYLEKKQKALKSG